MADRGAARNRIALQGGLMHDITGRVAEKQASQDAAFTGAQHDQIIVVGDRFHGDRLADLARAAPFQHRADVAAASAFANQGNVCGHTLSAGCRADGTG